MTLAPLPLVDDFLRPISVGQVLLVAFVLSVLGTLPLGSRKVLSLTVAAFGVIFLLTPIQLASIQYKFLGVALVVVGPMLYVTGER